MGPLPGKWLAAHIADLTPDLQVFYHKFIVYFSFMENSIGLKRVKYTVRLEMYGSRKGSGETVCMCRLV